MSELHWTVRPCADWIRERLPEDVTAEEANQALACLRDGEIEGATYRQQGEIAYAAEDEEALRRRLYSEVARWIAVAREPAHREEELRRYRYEWRTIRQGEQVVRFPPRERADYEYDATFDHRKWWMEEHLRLLKGVATRDELAATAAYYQDQLNTKYPDKHWAYNRWDMVFVEASRSKQRGIEDRLAGRKPKPWQFPEEKRFFVLRSFLKFARQWFIGI